MFNWLKCTKPCKACKKGDLYWNSTCNLCGYYQHSCISPDLYNYLKEDYKNAERLYYSKVFDRRNK